MPRDAPALILYGPGQWGLGAGVGTAQEARAAVDRFAELGYVQVKLYNSVPRELMPVIIERARSHGMRVSGHIPNGTTGREVMESGFEEIQHLFYVRIGAAQLRGLTPDDDLGARMAAVTVRSDEWRDFVGLLRSHAVVVDPTLAVVEESVGERPPVWLGKVLDRFPAQAGRVALHGVAPDSPPAVLRERWDDIVANGPELLRALYDPASRSSPAPTVQSVGSLSTANWSCTWRPASPRPRCSLSPPSALPASWASTTSSDPLSRASLPT